MVTWFAAMGRRGSRARSAGAMPGRTAGRPGRRALVAVLVGLALVAVACSGGGPAQPGGSAQPGGGSGGGNAGGKVVGDVCGLLTPEELKAQLGVDFPAGTVKFVSGSTATCDWETPVGQSSALVSLTVEAFDSTQWDMTKKRDSARPVPGLGDDAVFGFLDVLWVKKGDLDFTIQMVILPAPSAATLDAAKIELAKLVLSRL
ncbi:MAG: hypothetical protein C0498_05330 [Anaerolinea sp.]|nr:hypothetical protein [Anaerolinea sp.]